METSKKLLYLNYTFVGILTVIVIACTFMQIDCSNLTTVCSCGWVEVGAATSFYYIMCKRLNVPKVVKHIYDDLPPDLKDQVDINQLLQNLMN